MKKEGKTVSPQSFSSPRNHKASPPLDDEQCAQARPYRDNEATGLVLYQIYEAYKPPGKASEAGQCPTILLRSKKRMRLDVK
jgi:hypothetical protein